MSEQPTNWRKEDFLALLLFYAARADLNISETETDYIASLCGDEHCKIAKDYAGELSDYEVIESLKNMKGSFFPGEEGTAELHQHLETLFRADDDYSHLEHNILRGLERLW